MSSGAGRGFATQPSIEETAPPSMAEQKWNLRTLRKEVTRQHMRLFKKVGNVSQRLAKEQLSAPVEEGKYPNSERTKGELEGYSVRLAALAQLEASLSDVQSVKEPQFLALIPTLLQLNFTDTAVQAKPITPAAKVRPGPRKPYWTYRSIEDIEIRVGKNAVDNDELSCNKEHRANDEWWLHVSGHAGSHVVIRYTGNDLLEAHRQTVLDAALLAAVNSKCNQVGRVVVHVTRCRNVSKPSGVPAGLVHLHGDITPIKFDIKLERSRLDRLVRIV